MSRHEHLLKEGIEVYLLTSIYRDNLLEIVSRVHSQYGGLFVTSHVFKTIEQKLAFLRKLKLWKTTLRKTNVQKKYVLFAKGRPMARNGDFPVVNR